MIYVLPRFTLLVFMISGLVSEVALAESSFFYHDKSASILNAWESRNQQQDDFELDKLLDGTTDPHDTRYTIDMMTLLTFRLRLHLPDLRDGMVDGA